MWERGEVHKMFSWRDLDERDHFEDLLIGWRVILKWIFKK
jgi:hypothetical protein